MNNIFNTPFEISLRVLLMLETGLIQTADMIAAADFITVYGKDFEISDNDLHGDSAFKYSEFPLRRELVKKAVKQLVLTGLIDVASSQRGFLYSINQKGKDYCSRFTNHYAETYRYLAKRTQGYIAQKSERQIFEMINRNAFTWLQRGVNDV
ncbi:ABC-three component system middle component 2 [Desulfoscipio gibsoniae]|jgi:hypothetical protein|uniref:Uncharacterized protein n=1 Tax=Desulfoscipio gibsoniae DSM 7213 TaxID=767817 RepID=R4KLS0_9FIRM|nr:ABC-three component system middle component 2 [Desulfoscipio gibsoniae]AGL03619.1 hypothetical protein Desgi_4377 [Desulfoscipio gibsoniae DSM 7213]